LSDTIALAQSGRAPGFYPVPRTMKNRRDLMKSNFCDSNLAPFMLALVISAVLIGISLLYLKA
jgi:hypothetical protein